MYFYFLRLPSAMTSFTLLLPTFVFLILYISLSLCLPTLILCSSIHSLPHSHTYFPFALSFSSLPHWQDCHELWSKKRRRQRQSGVVVEEPPPSKTSRKETTSGTNAEPVKNSSPAPPQPAPGKVEPGAGDAIGQCQSGDFVLLLSVFGRFWRSSVRILCVCLCFSFCPVNH